MKVIGLIGGMSWESSAEYYRLINQSVRSRLGGRHYARSLMYSVDFHDVEVYCSFRGKVSLDEAGEGGGY